MKNVYILEIGDDFAFRCGMEFICRNFNTPGTIITLNTIREAFGLKPIRAEYEMCFGPDTEKPLDIQKHYDFKSESDECHGTIVVKVSNVVDLRQYYECNEDWSNYYDQ